MESSYAKVLTDTRWGDEEKSKRKDNSNPYSAGLNG